MAQFQWAVPARGRLSVSLLTSTDMASITMVERSFPPAPGASVESGVLSIDMGEGRVKNISVGTTSVTLMIPLRESFTLVNSSSFDIDVSGSQTPGVRATPVAVASAPPPRQKFADPSYVAPSEPTPPRTPQPPAVNGASYTNGTGDSAKLTAGEQELDDLKASNRDMVTRAWDSAAQELVSLKNKSKAIKQENEAAFQDALKKASDPSSESYQDPEFPAGRTSLFFDENVRQPTARLNEDVSKLWQNVEWKRPKLFLPAVMGPAIGSQGQGQSDKANLFHNAGEEAGSVEPDDIRQGAIGDCYFLSSLSVLAEQDDRIKFLFFKNDPATDRNTDAAVDRGLFAVRFCIQGHWTQVLLDDCFPCYPDEVEVQNGKPDEKHIGEPIFSHSKERELWVLVLEKAWAKVFGSYQHIIWGLPGECLTNLTGAPCKFTPTDPADPRAVWASIHEAVSLKDENAQGWFVVALMPEHSEEDKKVGLIEGHAYAVLDTVEIFGTPLIQLRNPWGSVEWTGDWSDADDKNWNQAAKNELRRIKEGESGLKRAETERKRAKQERSKAKRAARKQRGQPTLLPVAVNSGGSAAPDVAVEKKTPFEVDDLDDGIFWMNAQDFSKYFAGAQICRASRGWRFTSDDVKLRPNTASLLTLTVTDRPTIADITVQQMDRRKYFTHRLYNPADFKYLSINVLVLNAETCEIVNYARFKSDRDVWVEVPRPAAEGEQKRYLQPGKYWVLVGSDWDGKECCMSTVDDVDGRSQVVNVGVSCFYNPNVDPATGKQSTVELLAPNHCIPPLDGNRLKRLAFQLACEDVDSKAVEIARYNRYFSDITGAGLVSKSKYAEDHSDTVTWLYKNESENLMLTETITFTLTNMYVAFPLGLDSPDVARDKLWDIVVHPPTEDTPELQERLVRNEPRVVEVVVKLRPGETKLVQIVQVCGWMLIDWKSKVAADLEEL